MSAAGNAYLVASLESKQLHSSFMRLLHAMLSHAAPAGSAPILHQAACLGLEIMVSCSAMPQELASLGALWLSESALTCHSLQVS